MHHHQFIAEYDDIVALQSPVSVTVYTRGSLSYGIDCFCGIVAGWQIVACVVSGKSGYVHFDVILPLLINLTHSLL